MILAAASDIAMLASDRGNAENSAPGYADGYSYTAVPKAPPEAGEPVLQQVSAGPEQPGTCTKDMLGLANIFCTKLNTLLVFVPLGVLAAKQEWGPAAVFSTNFVAIVPLAAVLGAATEALAAHTGQTLGGLLNATFGNAVEMIVTVQALKANLVGVVQGSLLGSILSNLLLVLGMAFFVAGIGASESTFNATGASANTTCLVLASVALALPTVYSWVPETTSEDCLSISRMSSVVIAICYVLFLVFQLRTHADLFAAEDEDGDDVELSCVTSLLLLAATTVCVAVNSEYLVDSIDGVTSEYGMPQAFIGIIMLPIVGNAAEHATAVTVAAKGKMNLCLGVAVGSSTQIALLVVPFSVIIGWCYDVPMSLNFGVFGASVLVMSVFLVSTILGDGRSNWFEGAMLMATYILIGIMCWYIPDLDPVGRAEL